AHRNFAPALQLDLGGDPPRPPRLKRHRLIFRERHIDDLRKARADKVGRLRLEKLRRRAIAVTDDPVRPGDQEGHRRMIEEAVEERLGLPPLAHCAALHIFKAQAHDHRDGEQKADRKERRIERLQVAAVLVDGRDDLAAEGEFFVRIHLQDGAERLEGGLIVNIYGAVDLGNGFALLAELIDAVDADEIFAQHRINRRNLLLDRRAEMPAKDRQLFAGILEMTEKLFLVRRVAAQQIIFEVVDHAVKADKAHHLLAVIVHYRETADRKSTRLNSNH